MHFKEQHRLMRSGVPVCVCVERGAADGNTMGGYIYMVLRVLDSCKAVSCPR